MVRRRDELSTGDDSVELKEEAIDAALLKRPKGEYQAGLLEVGWVGMGREVGAGATVLCEKEEEMG